MAKQRWAAVLGLTCLAVACGGKAEHLSDGAAGGAGQVAIGESGAASGGESGAASCIGKLADVARVLGVECPSELCAGAVSASACDTLPAGVVRTSEAWCSQMVDNPVRSLTFELSATRGKTCYYQETSFEGPAVLVGARAWDDKAGLCGGALEIGAGATDCDSPMPTTLCDLADPAHNAQVSSNVPARACFNGFSATCEPCCAAKPPDCTKEPDGYPGYDCTPPSDDQGNISYCSCSCSDQQWICPC